MDSCRKTTTRRVLVLSLALVIAVAAALTIRWAVWPATEPGERSASGPFLRGPFLHNGRGDRMTVCWTTDQPAQASVHVMNDDGTTIRTLSTPSAATHQEIVIDGLQPNRHYRYEVQLTRRGARPLGGTFTTSPSPGTPCELAAWGDSRSNPETCKAIADLILKSGAPICLHSGDFVSQGYNPDEWDRMFFRPAAAMLRSVVCWPAIGNHELGKDINGVTGRQVFAQSFALPGDKLYYSFDYGDAHILVLDSNTDFSDNRAQYEFADRDLADAKPPWKIVMFHHPLFTSGGHGSQIDMRTRYGPLFARHNVDLIVVGHDHNYQRSRPIRHRYESLQKRPYVQIVSGGGGAPTYEILRSDDPWTAAATSKNHFVHINIDGNRLVGSAIGLDGQAFDRFEINKSFASSDAVAYEFIELERAYRNLALAASTCFVLTDSGARYASGVLAHRGTAIRPGPREAVQAPYFLRRIIPPASAAKAAASRTRVDGSGTMVKPAAVNIWIAWASKWPAARG